MKMHTRMFCLIVIAVLGLTTGAVQAQTGNYYIGANVGAAKLDTGITPLTSKLDENSTGFKLYGGYQFAPQFSLELAYANFGNAGNQFIVDGTVFQFLVNGQIKFEPTVFSIGGRFSLPISQAAEFYARLGIASWNVDISATTSGTTAGTSNESGSDPYYGVGFGWKFMPDVSLTIDYEHYEFDTQGGNYYSLGLVKYF
jgi:OOP family OmpA-OmpF porin